MSWTPVYRLTAKLSLLMLVLIPVQIAVFILSPPPETVLGFFELYHKNWLLGLLSLDLLYIVNNVIIIFIYLSLFSRLKDENPALALTGLVIGLVGLASYFPSNPTFEMLSLSQSYFNALPAAQPHFLAAGEALLAGFSGTAFDVYYVLNALTLLIYAKLILDSPQFSRATGLWGLASGVLMIIPSSAGMVGLVFSLLSLVPWVVFLGLLVGRFKAFASE